jgi:hypothetical protein
LAGVGSFVHEEETYQLFLFHYHIDTSVVRRFTPGAPDVPDGEIRITRGDPEDQAAIAPIAIVRDVITAEMDRLIPYQTARDAYFKASAAWHAANPPVPRDETIILRPHRGSRYLESTKH